MNRRAKMIQITGELRLSEKPGYGCCVTVRGEKAEIREAKLVYDFAFQPGDRLFLNGYQSWTLSKETGIRDFDHSMRFCPKALDRKFGFSRYGDGHFYPRAYKKGVQHGYSYAYIRRGETLFFFGSLCEDSGFTRIIFNTNENTVTFEKDCAGRVVEGEYTLFDLYFFEGTEQEAFDGWFRALGVEPLTTQKLTGYTSWYNYYQNISAEILMQDVRVLDTLPVKPDLFQIDDGYEAFVGDWLTVDEKKFPHGLPPIVEKIRGGGYRAGIWMAPFVCESKSALFREHQDWLLRDASGEPVYGGCNWSGMYALNIYHPEVRDYVRRCITHYREMGFTLFKLDFLYAACMVPSKEKTRGEIMADAMELLRSACGDCAILGCGVPLASAFGRVEFCRIGNDMTLDWNDKLFMRGFHSERPSTRNTMLSTLYRRQLSGRAFLNDPDVFLLRSDNILLTPQQKLNLAQLNCLLGGVLFTSDRVSDYSPEMRECYGQVIRLRDATFVSAETEGDWVSVSYRMDGQLKQIRWHLSGK